MGHQFKIEGDEAAALAEELAALTGQSVEAAVVEALRLTVAKEQKRRVESEAVRDAVIAFHGLLGDERPSSDHGWLYDSETGLPAW